VRALPFVKYLIYILATTTSQDLGWAPTFGSLTATGQVTTALHSQMLAPGATVRASYRKTAAGSGARSVMGWRLCRGLPRESIHG
jgi:hypothetical protein